MTVKLKISFSDFHIVTFIIIIIIYRSIIQYSIL